MLLGIHAENLTFFVVAMYLLAILVWFVICYYVIKIWDSRKRRK